MMSLSKRLGDELVSHGVWGVGNTKLGMASSPSRKLIGLSGSKPLRTIQLRPLL